VSSDDLAPDDIFTCTRCGDCCKGYGGTFVGPEDIAAIAAFIGSDPSEVAVRCCRLSGGKYILAQRENGYCIFWDHGGCTIHPVKPRLCRRWPFIESVVRDPLNWMIMAGFCPGMRTDVSLTRVRACVERLLASEKRMQLRSRDHDG
jgi:Fe-S-cluster containining protein